MHIYINAYARKYGYLIYKYIYINIYPIRRIDLLCFFCVAGGAKLGAKLTFADVC